MAARTEREELLSYISDAHKDAYGFRPRSNWSTYCAMSIEELRAEADELSEAVARAIKEQDERQAASAAEFEARIQSIIESGAGDRETAIRWDKASYEDLFVVEDDGYYCYLNDLPYGYFNREKEAA